MDNNDNFYTQFVFYEGLTGYKSINVIFKNPNDLWAIWFNMIYTRTIDIPYRIEQIISENTEFDISISFEGEEYIFTRESKESKIFKRKYSEDE